MLGESIRGCFVVFESKNEISDCLLEESVETSDVGYIKFIGIV